MEAERESRSGRGKGVVAELLRHAKKRVGVEFTASPPSQVTRDGAGRGGSAALLPPASSRQGKSCRAASCSNRAAVSQGIEAAAVSRVRIEATAPGKEHGERSCVAPDRGTRAAESSLLLLRAAPASTSARIEPLRRLRLLDRVESGRASPRRASDPRGRDTCRAVAASTAIGIEHRRGSSSMRRREEKNACGVGEEQIDHIFLTRVCSETAGGLPGLVLTLAGIGDEGMSVNIWGPSDLDFLAGAMRSFIPNRAMLHTHSFGVEGDVSSSQSKDSVVILDDEVVRISAMFVKPRYQRAANSLEDIDLKPGDTAIVYACELPEIKGKFDPAKAAALGLKAGPKYRELQLGNSVQSDQFNTMVHPNDVLGPSIPGPTVLLVDCPTQSHMQELFSLQALSCFYENSSDQTESGKKVNCIIHLGPSSVTKSVDYQSWMKKFGATQHIMAGHETKNIEIPILKGSARISSRLNFVCPQLFPSSGFWPVETANGGTEKNMYTSLETCESVPAQNLLKFHLRPYAQLGLDRASIPSLFTYEDIVEELISEIPEVREVPEHVRKFWHHNPDDKSTLASVGSMLMVEEPWISQNSDKLADGTHLQVVQRKHSKDNQEIPTCVENSTREDMEITFLGTGSSQPSKYRNVSSIYVNLFARGGILLDCGEGTLGQMKRRFGVNGADEAVKSLRCIWISHIHADHHTGLARVLALRSKLLKGVPHKPLLVIGPRPLERFLKAYSTLEDLDMQFLDCRHTLKPSVEAFLSENVNESAIPQLENTMFAPGSRMENFNRKPASPRDTASLNNLKEVLQESGLEILYSVPVVHCPQAFGVVLRAMEKNSAGKVIPGWKVVYSGDTRPCPALIDASRDATVLIHEATFEDSMKDEAIARNHSTTKEAIEVGTSAGAYRIILTHFSQRYPKIPVIDEVDMEKTCIAFDLMSVNLTDLPVLPKVLPHLKVLFKDELVAEEADEIQEAVTY